MNSKYLSKNCFSKRIHFSINHAYKFNMVAKFN